MGGGEMSLRPSSRVSSWTDNRDSYVAGLVHVRQEPGDGDVADSLLKEHLLDGGGADGAQGGQEQEELSEATGLSRVPGRHFPPKGQSVPVYDQSSKSKQGRQLWTIMGQQGVRSAASLTNNNSRSWC